MNNIYCFKFNVTRWRPDVLCHLRHQLTWMPQWSIFNTWRAKKGPRFWKSIFSSVKPYLPPFSPPVGGAACSEFHIYCALDTGDAIYDSVIQNVFKTMLHVFLNILFHFFTNIFNSSIVICGSFSKKLSTYDNESHNWQILARKFHRQEFSLDKTHSLKLETKPKIVVDSLISSLSNKFEMHFPNNQQMAPIWIIVSNCEYKWRTVCLWMCECAINSVHILRNNVRVCVSLSGRHWKWVFCKCHFCFKHTTLDLITVRIERFNRIGNFTYFHLSCYNIINWMVQEKQTLHFHELKKKHTHTSQSM